jgi:hypothetical protein
VLQINALAAHFPAEYKVEIRDSGGQLLFHTQANETTGTGLSIMNGTYRSTRVGITRRKKATRCMRC